MKYSNPALVSQPVCNVFFTLFILTCCQELKYLKPHLLSFFHTYSICSRVLEEIVASIFCDNKWITHTDMSYHGSYLNFLKKDVFQEDEISSFSEAV